MTQSTNRLGQLGEELAVRHLEDSGYRVLARNWRAALGDVRGEVDIVAAQGHTLVFCEVKSRRRSVSDSAFAAVTWTKQRQLRRLAGLYLMDQQPWADVRFDVVAVTWPATGGPALVDHIQGAF